MSMDFEVMVPPEGANSGATQKGMLSATAAANSGQVNAALASRWRQNSMSSPDGPAPPIFETAVGER